MVFVFIFSSQKSYKLEKTMEKTQKNFFITLFAKKFQSEKKFDITFSLKRSLHRFRKINQTMNPIFGLVHEIYELK